MDTIFPPTNEKTKDENPLIWYRIMRRTAMVVAVAVKEGGDVGNWRLTEKLVSFWMMAAIVGLSAISSWTHNNVMWIHLITSPLEWFSFSVGSNSSKAVPFFHNAHACKNFSFFSSSLLTGYISKKSSYEWGSYLHKLEGRRHLLIRGKSWFSFR